MLNKSIFLMNYLKSLRYLAGYISGILYIRTNIPMWFCYIIIVPGGFMTYVYWDTSAFTEHLLNAYQYVKYYGFKRRNQIKFLTNLFF